MNRDWTIEGSKNYSRCSGNRKRLGFLRGQTSIVRAAASRTGSSTCPRTRPGACTTANASTSPNFPAHLFTLHLTLYLQLRPLHFTLSTTELIVNSTLRLQRYPASFSSACSCGARGLICLLDLARNISVHFDLGFLFDLFFFNRD